jgi:hypothetical protein
MVALLDFASASVKDLIEPFKGSNISSTPWIGDMDGDRLLDVVFCHSTNARKAYTFDGVRVHRVATGVPLKSEIFWGTYMGSRHNGIFQARPLAQRMNH